MATNDWQVDDGEVMMKSRAGFTLVEVLVALTLLTLFFGVLFQVFAGGLAVIRSGDAQSRAALLAKSKLAEISADHRIGPGTHFGTFELGPAEDQEFSWRAELIRYSEDELGRADRGELVPYRVELRIDWRADNGERFFRLTSLVLRPK